MTNKSDKMANWPMFKLLYSMSIPAVFSMLIHALYNIVDSIYISRYSQDALFAMGLVFPLQIVTLSLALGGAIGTGTLVSRRLGQKNVKEASFTATTGLLLTFFHMIIISLIGMFFSKYFLSYFSDKNHIISMGYDYLAIVMGINVGMFMDIFFGRIQQSQGNMILPMISQIIGAVTNIILDPILIFGWAFIPELGIKGAAIATVTGQIAAAIFIIYMSFKGNHEVNIIFKNFKLDFKRIKAIYEVGLPIAILNAIGSIATTAMNSVLVSYSDTAVTALSINFKLQSFIFMPVFGFNQGSLPILSYNFGAMNFKRYKEAIKIYLFSSVTIMILGSLTFMLVPKLLLNLFNPDIALLVVGIKTLRRISLGFPVIGASIVMSTVFQSLGKGYRSMFMSVSRQLLFLVPLAYILGELWGLDFVWFSYPLAEIIVFIIYLPVCIKTLKNSFNI